MNSIRDGQLEEQVRANPDHTVFQFDIPEEFTPIPDNDRYVTDYFNLQGITSKCVWKSTP